MPINDVPVYYKATEAQRDYADASLTRDEYNPSGHPSLQQMDATNSPSAQASLHSMDYNEAERAVRAIEASAAVIKEIGDWVNGKVALLNANDFKGKAGDSYQAAFHKWHKGYSLIRQNLITLGEKMAEANDGLQYEEATLAAANDAYDAPDQLAY
ncbi:MAG: WXG100 family type VII secretion target [Angustibacter sp.]